jgi:predicted aspartyl protease
MPALAEYYKYTDRNGIIFWVDDENKIPPQYRDQGRKTVPKDKPGADSVVTVEKPKRYTKVIIINNQIIVPVVLVNKGHKTAATMILDTGASSTIIYPGLAKRLGINANRVSAGVSKIADGSQVASYMTKIDYIQVDDSVLRNPDIVIMPSMSDLGAEGLLGNSFLKYFHFAIDYDKQMLIWD